MAASKSDGGKYVGFKRMFIKVLDGKTVEPIVIEGKENEGATVTASISGLAKEQTKVPGSDLDYYIARKGIGDVKVEFGLLDLPEGVSDILAGYSVNEKGITYIGQDTEPPMCAIILESGTLQGEKAMLGFFKGSFSRDEISLETLNPSETFEPGAETWTYNAIASTLDGPSNGQYVGKAVGPKEDEMFEQLKNEVLQIKTTP